MKFNEFFDHYHQNIQIDDDSIIWGIAEKLGEKLVRTLGTGSYGIAYLTESGKVLKITTDEWEALTAKFLMDKNISGIVKYYKVVEIDSPNLITAYDYDAHSDDGEEYGIEQYALPIYALLMDYVQPITDDSIRRLIRKVTYLIKFRIDAVDKLKNIQLDLEGGEKGVISELIDILESLNSLGIESIDFNEGGVGLYNNQLTLFDISGRHSHRVKIEKLEN